MMAQTPGQGTAETQRSPGILVSGWGCSGANPQGQLQPPAHERHLEWETGLALCGPVCLEKVLRLTDFGGRM